MAKRKTLAPWKPSREIQLKSVSRRVPDLIAPDLQVLFCGINPGLYSAAVGHHFAGPGNLFWPTLFATGFTSRLLTAFDEPEMLALGYGITNMVPRASATAEDLTKEELRAGVRTVKRKVRRFKPKYLAVLGLAAYRVGFEKTKAQVGLQEEKIGTTQIYLLPNPSGLNAFHQPAVLNEMFASFHALLTGVPRETAASAPRETPPEPIKSKPESLPKSPTRASPGRRARG